MSDFKPTARLAERNAVCRACGGSIPKSTPMISWYSPLNQGMHIHLHEECCIKLGLLAVTSQTERGENE